MMRYQPMMPELCAKLGEEHAEKMIRESSLDALWVVLGTFGAMSCTNVFIRQESRRLTLNAGQGAHIALDPLGVIAHCAGMGAVVGFKQAACPSVRDARSDRAFGVQCRSIRFIAADLWYAGPEFTGAGRLRS